MKIKQFSVWKNSATWLALVFCLGSVSCRNKRDSDSEVESLSIQNGKSHLLVTILDLDDRTPGVTNQRSKRFIALKCRKFRRSLSRKLMSKDLSNAQKVEIFKESCRDNPTNRNSVIVKKFSLGELLEHVEHKEMDILSELTTVLASERMQNEILLDDMEKGLDDIGFVSEFLEDIYVQLADVSKVIRKKKSAEKELAEIKEKKLISHVNRRTTEVVFGVGNLALSWSGEDEEITHQTPYESTLHDLSVVLAQLKAVANEASASTIKAENTAREPIRKAKALIKDYDKNLETVLQCIEDWSIVRLNYFRDQMVSRDHKKVVIGAGDSNFATIYRNYEFGKKNKLKCASLVKHEIFLSPILHHSATRGYEKIDKILKSNKLKVQTEFFRRSNMTTYFGIQDTVKYIMDFLKVEWE